MTRPTLFHYIAEREELEENSSELFEVVVGGHVDVPVNARYPVAEAADAHRALESRRTTGSTVLVVE
jgi:NADPH2:quinone reductase